MLDLLDVVNLLIIAVVIKDVSVFKYACRRMMCRLNFSEIGGMS